ncbi:nuclear transport factor 2 family protein [Candidatus Saccharibacteria bacterium]|nr:nuclear transport factor 2 family protein [Candidatus Saccharibacteria bacterium]
MIGTGHEHAAIKEVISNMPVLKDRKAWESVHGISLSEFVSMEHQLKDHRIEISGDEADAATYFQAVHHRTDGGKWLLGGAYHIRLQRLVDGWRVKSVKMVPVWSWDEPAGGAALAA